jgi:uncharacterized protein
VKLVRTEPCTRDLLDWLCDAEDTRRVSSALFEVEVPRALRRSAPGALYRIEIKGAIRAAPGAFTDSRVRSLDAIHLATASQLAPDLRAFVSYDVRLLDLAERMGLPVIAPGFR